MIISCLYLAWSDNFYETICPFYWQRMHISIKLAICIVVCRYNKVEMNEHDKAAFQLRPILYASNQLMSVNSAVYNWEEGQVRLPISVGAFCAGLRSILRSNSMKCY